MPCSQSPSSPQQSPWSAHTTIAAPAKAASSGAISRSIHSMQAIWRRRDSAASFADAEWHTGIHRVASHGGAFVPIRNMGFTKIRERENR